ncbi:MAG: N-6 DNA methylase [Nitrospira sp.]|nr:N-6 DNA methylase [Nitrospira sp.]
MKNKSSFVALRVEGGLFPAEFLNKVAAFEAKHQKAEDYLLARGLNLRDEIGRAWRIAEAEWRAYRDNCSRQDVNHAELAQDWQTRLLKAVLGFEDVEKAAPQILAERRFPLTHQGGVAHIPLVLVSAQFKLDKVSVEFGDEGKRRSPHGLMQEYLNAAGEALWGIVGNGASLRLLRDNPSLTRPAFVEADLERMFEERLFSDFAVFWLIFHASRFPRTANQPKECVLEAWREDAHATGERALDNLRGGVTTALRHLGTGFVAHPENRDLRAALQDGVLSLDVYFQQLLRLVYRLIFLFTAEERELLHPDDTPDEAKALYEAGYSAALLRDRALKRRHYDQYVDLWEGMQVTFRALATGCAPLGLPALGGLFNLDQCPQLDSAVIGNEHLLRAIHALSFFRTGETLSRINYRDMDTEELGSVYESLLELHPRLDVEVQPWKFGFVGEGDESSGAGGTERKRSGSYYTPDSLVQELIKSALEPVIRQTLEKNPENPRQALLRLKVCDPACGSGHFLLAAARRLAFEIARLEAVADIPDENIRRHALREVVSHCIYGVDKNPLAVELARTALWLETIEPGRPLGFLDHHIRCGDALVGILDPKILAAGIPSDAYAPLTGDDKETAKELKKQNTAARKALEQDGARSAAMSELGFTEVEGACVNLDAMPEDNLQQVAAKSAAWAQCERLTERSRAKHMADLFVAAFFAIKTPERAATCPTTEDLHRLLRGVEPRAGVLQTAREVAQATQAFHWRLAFPEVFEQGGFDVLLGNPPWERIKLQEEEFFAARSPRIASARNKAERKRLIRQLAESGNPAEHALHDDFIAAHHAAEAASLFAHDSGRYPLTGVGDVNTYALFAEAFFQLVAPSGRAGFIVPTGIATDDSTKAFFAHITQHARLVSLYDLENREAVFPAVDRRYKFCLLTLGQAAQAEFVFFATRVEQLADPRRRFRLNPDEFRLLNPNTLTCPVFRSERDAELTKTLYRAAPVLIDDHRPDGNPWGISFQRMVDMSNDSHLFADAPGEGRVPLYEAKMIHQFDHRWATYDKSDSRDVTEAEKRDPAFSPRPRYWVDEREVLARIADVPRKLAAAWLKADRQAVIEELALWLAGHLMNTAGIGRVQAELGRINKLLAAAARDSKMWKRAAELAASSPMTAEMPDELAHAKTDDALITLVDEWMERLSPRWLMGWRDITNATNERTVIAAVVPRVGVGNKIPLFMLPSGISAQHAAALLANLSSLVLDFVARQKIGGTTLNYFYMKQFPILPPERYTPADLDFIVPRVLELTYTAWDLQPWAQDLGFNGPPFAFDPARRAQLRAELDAWYAKLYGLTRDELRYILDPADVEGPDYPSETFRVLKENEIRKYGDYRTQKLVLHYYDRLMQAEAGGNPYEPEYTPLPGSVSVPSTIVA